jgi:hypothetical protein
LNRRNPFSAFKVITATHDARSRFDHVERNYPQVVDELLMKFSRLDQDTVQRLHRFLDQPMYNIRESNFNCIDELPEILHEPMEHARRLYESSCHLTRDIQYTTDDIREFCTLTGLSGSAASEQTGPLGIFTAALVNTCSEPYFEFNCRGHQSKLHFMGFGLESGKHMVVQGNLGHFTGAALNGGELKINGEVDCLCAAGMIKGRIKIVSEKPSTPAQKRQRWFYGIPEEILEIVR